MSSVAQFRKPAQNAPDHDAAQGMEILGRIVGSVAHDFNNLITGVLLYSDLLSKELPADSRLQRHVAGIRKAGENGAALIQQMLAVARPQLREQELLAAGPAVSEMYDLLSRLVGENIELIFDAAPGCGLVRMSPPQFHRIILNLVLNSRDAMPQGGRITILVRSQANPKTKDPECKLTVRDTGCGMDEDVRLHLFEPFFTTKRSSGNGLGLFTVHNIVTQAGGRLAVSSSQGAGTEVCVFLPRADAISVHPNKRRER